MSKFIERATRTHCKTYLSSPTRSGIHIDSRFRGNDKMGFVIDSNKLVVSVGLWVACLLFFLFILTTHNSQLTTAFAQDMSSQNYKLDGGNFNMTSGNKSSTNFKLSDVVGQTAAGIFASKGYIIQAGFLNGAAGETFSFSVIPSLADFGELTPNNPVEKTLRITISNGNATGYSVRASENQPLSTLAGAQITDTVCNSGITPCTINQTARWNQNTAYGFGFHMTGRTVPKDFTQADTLFRPFAATARNESPIVIMQSEAKKVVDQATMTLRLNIGPNQAVGQYRNVLSFSALVGV